MIDGIANAPNVPSIMFHGRTLRCRRDRAVEGDDTVPRADLDGGCMDGGISIENQAHGIADGIVAVFLGGLGAEGVDHILSSRNPPGEGTSEPFLGEARHLAGEPTNRPALRWSAAHGRSETALGCARGSYNQ